MDPTLIAQAFAAIDELVDIADDNGEVDYETAVDVLKAYLPEKYVTLITNPITEVDSALKQADSDPVLGPIAIGLKSRIRKLERKNNG